MKHTTYIHRTTLLSLLSLSFGVSAVRAQDPDPKKPEDIEKSDPFTKGAAGAESKTAKNQGAEMLDAQARILFARGETQKAIALQKQAVDKAKDTALELAETLAKYEGHAFDRRLSLKLDEIIIPRVDFENTTLEEAEKLNKTDTPFEELQQLSHRIGEITRLLNEKEMRWLELSELTER